MPSETFFRLPEEKRVRLIDAIYRELSRVPATEMSINRIVHGAGIPRGSFYQYFTNKEDMIAFILGEFTKNVKSFMDSEAPFCMGDPFLMLRKILLEVYAIGEQPKAQAFVRNLLTGLKAHSDIIPQFCQGAISDTMAVAWFDTYFDRSSICDVSNDDFPLILDLLLSVLKTSIAELFLGRIDKDEVIRRFDAKVMFLKYGLLPAKER